MTNVKSYIIAHPDDSDATYKLDELSFYWSDPDNTTSFPSELDAAIRTLRRYADYMDNEFNKETK